MTCPPASEIAAFHDFVVYHQAIAENGVLMTPKS